jgi:hypothetical protein
MLLARRGYFPLLGVDPFGHFLAVDGHAGGRRESQPHAVAADFQHGQFHAIPDPNPFATLST